MRRLQRRLAIVLSTVLLGGSLMAAAAPAAPATAAPAQRQFAASRPIKNTDHFKVSSYRFVSKFQVCVKATAKGTITYTAQHWSGFQGGGFTDEWRVTDVVIKAPTTYTAFYSYDSVTHGCTTHRVKMHSATMRIGYAAYSCKWNPSLFLGAPFAVGINFWPSCGKHSVYRRQVSDSKVSGQSLSSSQSRLHFGDQQILNNGERPGFHCMGARVLSTIGDKHGRHSDADSKRMRICLSPTYS